MPRETTRQEKAERVQRILDQLYPETDIPLDHDDPYTLLVATILSAQSTDKKVNQVTPRLFERASTPEEMAALEVAEIAALIREVGLAPQKAEHIKRSSEMLAEQGGRVPDTFEELEALPGVGHKTASVVMTQAFGKPAFPVDTHIHRLAARWGLSAGTSVVQTERDLKSLFPEERWGRVHLQMIYFGREHCPARGHDPRACPICSWAAVSPRGERRPMRAEELPDRDLVRIRRRARRALASGDLDTEGMRRYGVHDLGTLEAWIGELEREVERRDVGA